jgi:site-specific recombinase
MTTALTVLIWAAVAFVVAVGSIIVVTFAVAAWRFLRTPQTTTEERRVGLHPDFKPNRPRPRA